MLSSISVVSANTWYRKVPNKNITARQPHINLVTKDLDTLAGVRTRQIQRKLRAVQSVDAKVELLEADDE